MQGVVGAVMEVSQVSRENLLMLNLSFRFRLRLACHLLVMVRLVREGPVSGGGRGAGVPRGEEPAGRPFEYEEPDLMLYK